MFNPWYIKNATWLEEKHPRLKRIYQNAQASPSALSLGIFEEFVIISIITFISVEMKIYALWFGVLIVFFLHLCGHVGGAILKRGYVPSLFTSIFCIIYTIVIIDQLLKIIQVDSMEILFWTVISFIILIIDFPIVTKIIDLFDKWLAKWSMN